MSARGRSGDVGGGERERARLAGGERAVGDEHEGAVDRAAGGGEREVGDGEREVLARGGWRGESTRIDAVTRIDGMNARPARHEREVGNGAGGERVVGLGALHLRDKQG